MDKLLDYMLAGLVTGAFTIAGVLLKKFFDQINESFVGVNKKLDDQNVKLDKTSDEVASIKTEVNGYKMLADYQEKRICSLEEKNESLTKSHAAIDKQIAVAVATGALKKTS